MGQGQLDTQLLLMELMRRMEEMYPVLAASSGRPVAPTPPGMSFVSYTYGYNENPQVVQTMQQACHAEPPFLLDQSKLAQATHNNPDPRVCFPVASMGLPALEARVNQQKQMMAESMQALEDLKGAFANLQGVSHTQGLQLEECRRRHQKLQRQLLHVVSSMETYAALNGAARRDQSLEAQLEERFGRLEEAVHAPGSARARLEELWVVLRGLLQRGPPSGGAARISSDEAQTTLQVTAAQGELLEALQLELALRKRDVAQFEHALARAAEAQIVGAQSGVGAGAPQHGGAQTQGMSGGGPMRALQLP